MECLRPLPDTVVKKSIVEKETKLPRGDTPSFVSCHGPKEPPLVTYVGRAATGTLGGTDLVANVVSHCLASFVENSSPANMLIWPNLEIIKNSVWWSVENSEVFPAESFTDLPTNEIAL